MGKNNVTSANPPLRADDMMGGRENTGTLFVTKAMFKMWYRRIWASLASNHKLTELTDMGGEHFDDSSPFAHKLLPSLRVRLYMLTRGLIDESTVKSLLAMSVEEFKLGITKADLQIMRETVESLTAGSTKRKEMEAVIASCDSLDEDGVPMNRHRKIYLLVMAVEQAMRDADDEALLDSDSGTSSATTPVIPSRVVGGASLSAPVMPARGAGGTSSSAPVMPARDAGGVSSSDPDMPARGAGGISSSFSLDPDRTARAAGGALPVKPSGKGKPTRVIVVTVNGKEVTKKGEKLVEIMKMYKSIQDESKTFLEALAKH